MQVNETTQLPDAFSIADLEAAGLNEQEIAAVSTGEDSIIAPIPPTAEETATAEAAALAEAEAAALAEAEATAQAEAARIAAEQIKVAPLPDTSKAEAVIAEFDTKMDALQGQYDDGDMTSAEFKAQMKALASEQAKAESLLASATEIATRNNQDISKSWGESLKAFSALGNEALFDPDGPHYKGFDAALKAVEIQHGHNTIPFDKMIALAARNYANTYETVSGKSLTLNIPGQKAAKADPDAKLPDGRPDAIKTLTGLNSPGEDAISDSTFAAIDIMSAKDPLKAEEMLASLPADRREAYLN